jgi:lysyl-tRNA synthetase class 2
VSQEDTIYQVRKEKLDKIGELGVDTYPRRFDRTHDIKEVQNRFGDLSAEELEGEKITVRVAGRIVSLRPHGKAGFAHLFDGKVRLQVYFKKDELIARDFEIFKLLDIGDFIGVKGFLFRTRTGELTVMVNGLSFLTKSLRPLPEKWHGLTDVELRYRQRYLDLIANPEVRRLFELRAKTIQSFRDFLNGEGFLEVETPMMQSIPGGATARPFKTFHNALGIDLYLRIAPELYLKRLVVGGVDRVYEINKNFRNEGISTQHNPEFTMLEFYIAYYDYKEMMELTERMFSYVVEKTLGTNEITYNKEVISFSPPWPRVTLSDALAKWADIEPEDLLKQEKLVEIASERNIDISDCKSRGRVMAKLFDELVQPFLIKPTFIIDYPIDISPLSKNKPGDPETVERFELFIGGLELANGYSELNDPAEQRRRFEDQVKERAKGDLEAHEMDEDYLRALEYGMPPTAGEGVGIDRVMMLFTDSRSIREVILFPQLKPKEKS